MELPSDPDLVVSCEHAGNRVPEQYQTLFQDSEEILESHRGWDHGALKIAETIATFTEAALFSYPYTRLLVDVNRSAGNPKLFSQFSRKLTEIERQNVIKYYYQPYRESISERIPWTKPSTNILDDW